MDNRKRLRMTIIVLAVALIAVLSFGAVEYTSQTGFCSSCHEMNTAYAGWQKGVHQTQHCYGCHTDEGFIAKTKVKLNGLREVYIHLTGDVNMDKVKADVPENRCLKCHDFSKTDKHGERIVSFHKQHQALQFGCFTCHGDVGHTGEKFTGFKNSACQQCHDRKSNPRNMGKYLKKDAKAL